MLGLDQLIATTCASGANSPPSPPKGWANQYSSYMNNLMTKQNAIASTEISRRLDPAAYGKETTDAAGKLNSLGTALSNFQKNFPTARWTFNAAALLGDFPRTSSLQLAKRQDEIAACTAPPDPVQTPHPGPITAAPPAPTIPPPSASTPSCKTDSDCPPNFCTQAGQTLGCLLGQCLCLSSSLNLGPLSPRTM